MHGFSKRYDAVVVGGRVAGASTAMLLARAGCKVLLIDRQAYGSDRLSTHALMRGAVTLLSDWGVLPSLMAQDTPAVRQTSFIYAGEAVTLDIKPDGYTDCLIAPRRTVLDRKLADAAETSGAEVRHGTALRELVFDRHGRVIGCVIANQDGAHTTVGAGIVIGADGRQSSVARLTGAETYRQGVTASGCVYGYFEGMPDRGFEWYFGDGVAAGAIPTNHGQHCVFVSAASHRFASLFRDDIRAGFVRVCAANSPELAEAVKSARLCERLKGFGGQPGYFRQSFGEGWALVGDAGYFKDPITAHGITDAFRDAFLLARAITGGQPEGLAGYQALRDELSADLFDITESVAAYDWDMPAVQAMHYRLSRAMKSEAEVLNSMLGVSRLAA